MLDLLAFGVLPYVAVVLFVGVSVTRYRKEPFTFSSLSSQFLETRRLFWGSVPFHIGVLLLFFGHLVGFLIPRAMIWWNGVPARLFVLEATGFAAGLLTLIGLLALMARRVSDARLRATTSVTDLLVYVSLTVSVCSGLWVALALRWGSAWYTHTAVPYLWSLAIFRPDIARVAELPLPAKVHIVAAFVLFGLFSFTRLVHILVAPLPYLWRPTQLVIWNRQRRSR